ncbi:PEP-CTERM sorting domain-containing protein [Roseateles sp.]|uniref:PEP-CTERM sorting domain-containing protein n=1 Tax=Roseateles sp. TaxID=1971397 RepID=UPI003BAA626B
MNPLRPNRLAMLPLLALAFTAVHAADLAVGGYQQNFDAMGTSGTTPPAGWSVLTGNAGTTNATWTNTIPGNGANSVASMVATSGSLTVTTAPSGTNNNGFNAALSAAATADRVLATSPTTVTGTALQLSLTNTTGASFSALTIGFDTVRFTSVTTDNELPGYWLFYSLDGSNWTNLSDLNPTISTVPNTVGVTTLAPTLVTLSTPVADGQTLYLRWVDDNARQTSPDQILGLDNVSISAVPEPTPAGLLALGLAAGALLRRRKA